MHITINIILTQNQHKSYSSMHTSKNSEILNWSPLVLMPVLKVLINHQSVQAGGRPHQLKISTPYAAAGPWTL